MIYIETIGTLTGFLCVYLHTKQHIFGFPIALVSLICYVYIFAESRLYADMALQIFFIFNVSYGWYNWAIKSKTDEDFDPTKTSWSEWLVYLWLSIGMSLCISFILRRYTDSDMIWSDSITTSISLLAQYLLAKKKIENWILWFVVDIIYVGMYVYKNLYLTALLYTAYLGLCIYGYLLWHKNLKTSHHSK